MSIEIKLDRESCQGYGNCVLVAEELFEIDDEGLGVPKAVIVDSSQTDAVRRAAYDCPTDSISFVELAEDGGADPGAG